METIKKLISFLLEEFLFEESMSKYGTDKPDLRNPLEITDFTELFKSDEVKLDIFKKILRAEV